MNTDNYGNTIGFSGEKVFGQLAANQCQTAVDCRPHLINDLTDRIVAITGAVREMGFLATDTGCRLLGAIPCENSGATPPAPNGDISTLTHAITELELTLPPLRAALERLETL